MYHVAEAFFVDAKRSATDPGKSTYKGALRELHPDTRDMLLSYIGAAPDMGVSHTVRSEP